jgi:hypothetical protein
MPLIPLLAILWLLFVILVVAALSGWLVNIIYFFAVCIRAAADVACQAWIDVSRLWSKRVKLDEHEKKLS